MATSINYFSLESSQTEMYNMNHPKRGYAVIINNYEFHDLNRCKSLDAQKKDVENFKISFLKLNFKDTEIQVYENQTKIQMKAIMNDYANKDFTNIDCFIGVFLSRFSS